MTSKRTNLINSSRYAWADIRRMLTLAICLLWACGINATPSISHKDLEAALNKVDHELSLREGYVANRKRFIERLKRDMDTVARGEVSLKKILAVGEAYEGFNTVGSIEQVYLRNALAVNHGAVQETQGVYLKRGVSTL